MACRIIGEQAINYIYQLVFEDSPTGKTAWCQFLKMSAKEREQITLKLKHLRSGETIALPPGVSIKIYPFNKTKLKESSLREIEPLLSFQRKFSL